MLASPGPSQARAMATESGCGGAGWGAPGPGERARGCLRRGVAPVEERREGLESNRRVGSVPLLALPLGAFWPGHGTIWVVPVALHQRCRSTTAT